jgi:two-component system, chemotaxis family, response regulator Rcp1
MSNERTDSAVQILLVENNPGDVRLVQEALKETQTSSRLHVAKDAFEAMDMLRQKGKYASTPRPDILLLDLNMPRKTGLEFLAEIKNDESLKSIPVVIVTSSLAQADINNSLGLYANCYLIKPIDPERLTLVLRTVKPESQMDGPADALNDDPLGPDRSPEPGC